MLNEIRNFHQQFSKALLVAKETNLPNRSDNFKNIYLCGMGGSSLP